MYFYIHTSSPARTLTTTPFFLRGDSILARSVRSSSLPPCRLRTRRVGRKMTYNRRFVGQRAFVVRRQFNGDKTRRDTLETTPRDDIYWRHRTFVTDLLNVFYLPSCQKSRITKSITYRNNIIVSRSEKDFSSLFFVPVLTIQHKARNMYWFIYFFLLVFSFTSVYWSTLTQLDLNFREC